MDINPPQRLAGDLPFRHDETEQRLVGGKVHVVQTAHAAGRLEWTPQEVL